MNISGLEDQPFAVVHDVAATWDDYDAIRRALARAPVNGLVLHAAGPTDDGFRTIDIWTSHGAWDRFRSNFEHAFDGSHLPPVMRELQIRHLTISPTAPDMTVFADPSERNSHDQ